MGAEAEAVLLLADWHQLSYCYSCTVLQQHYNLSLLTVDCVHGTFLHHPNPLKGYYMLMIYGHVCL